MRGAKEGYFWYQSKLDDSFEYRVSQYHASPYACVELEHVPIVIFPFHSFSLSLSLSLSLYQKLLIDSVCHYFDHVLVGRPNECFFGGPVSGYGLIRADSISVRPAYLFL